MGKLNAGQCNGRTPESLEASHGSASAFDRSMILLDPILPGRAIDVIAARDPNLTEIDPSTRAITAMLSSGGN